MKPEKIINFNKETLYLGNICIIRMELRLVNKTRYSENTICSISLLLTQVVLLIIKGSLKWVTLYSITRF